MHSNTDALLIAIPMIAVLIAGFFRLDELIAAPKKKRLPNRRVIAGSDEYGRPICIDPDGNPSR
jgi:hypothetical protein